MPNLVVYVPTSLWKKMDALGLADPRIEARKVARGALTAWLSEGEAGGPGVVQGAAEPAQDEPPHRSPSESQPTPAMCGMSNRHPSRTKQNPCPRCGYPT